MDFLIALSFEGNRSIQNIHDHTLPDTRNRGDFLLAAIEPKP